MQNIPFFVTSLFVLTTILTVILFLKASGNNRKVLYILAAWLALQGFIAYSEFYANTTGIPPRFMLSVLPPFLCIFLLFVTAKGRQFIDRLKLQTLTLLNIVRLPVEIVLFWLCVYKAIPQVMTFEGNNFDILSGITAPIIFYITRRNPYSNVLLVWNIACLALLLNIVITAVLAAPFDFQQIAFEQPNIAVLYFPFIWLPAIVVPIVLLSHLVSIRQVILKKTTYKTVAAG